MKYILKEILRHPVEIFKKIVLTVFDCLSILHVDRNGVDGNCALLVRMDAIGDFILWLDAASKIAHKERAAGRRVILAANARWADFASGFGIFDEVWPIDRIAFERRLRYRAALLRRVRGQGFARAIHPTISRELIFGDSIMRACNAPVRIGSCGDTSNRNPIDRWIGDRWYTTLIPLPKVKSTEIEANADFLAGLGIASLPRLIRLPWPKPGDAAPYFVVVPGAGQAGRQWPAASFAAVADRIHATTGWNGILVGGAGERASANSISRLAQVPLTDRTGGTDLAELMTILAGAKLVLSNDTGPLHMATAVGTPSVCILGGGHFGRFLPYPRDAATPAPRVLWHEMECFGCNWICRFPRRQDEAFACVRGVTVEQVWSEVVQILAGSQD